MTRLRLDPAQVQQDGPLATAAPCSAHRSHSPEPLYCEEHHVLPRAWQNFWHPTAAPLSTDGLFDARVVPLCRTGHGNVHFMLVAIMRKFERLKGVGGILAAEQEALKDLRFAHPRLQLSRSEREVVRLGMTRWEAAGGDLLALCAAGLYGVI